MALPKRNYSIINSTTQFENFNITPSTTASQSNITTVYK